MSDIIIRKMQFVDRDLLSPLRELGSTINISREEFEEIYLERSDNNIHTLVAIMDQTIVGTGSVWIEPKFIHNGGFVAHIEDVALLAEYHKLGIGKMLIQDLVGIAKKCGCYKVILNCNLNNIEFYEKLGFKETGCSMRLSL